MPNKQWTVTSDKFLTAEEITRFLKHIEQERDLAIARDNDKQAIRDYYLARGLLETGCRVAEFCSLLNSDFNGLKLVVQNGKGGKPRTILLTRATSLMLKEWTAVKQTLGFSIEPYLPLFPSRYNEAYSTRGVQKKIKELFRKSGLPSNLSCHSLRHTYCSLLLASGKVGIGTVRDNLGHHSLTVTNLYSHAIGNLGDVDLYERSSSENCENSELSKTPEYKKVSSLVERFLRNAN